MTRLRQIEIATRAVAVILLAVGCSPPAPESDGSPVPDLVITSLDPPAGPDSLAPNLATAAGSVVATWLEPVAGDAANHFQLLISRLSDSTWSEPVTVAAEDDFFANWADLPAVVETGGGELLAHWLARTGEETYAYSIFLARSEDGGATWRGLGKLNADATPTEHGFVSWVAEGDGARAFWLDGRSMANGGAMAIRTAHVGDRIGAEEILDERTCECCSTDAAQTATGPVVVYRGRSAEEVRDIRRVRRSGEGWSTPGLVHEDGWRIEGCPVNGPQIAALGESVVVGWYTGTSIGSIPGPSVRLAFSDDGGASFEPPVLVDAAAPIGRVDVALDEHGNAYLVWMRKAGKVAEIRLERVAADGTQSESLLVATTSAARSSGFPRLVAVGGSIYLCWVDVGEDEARRIRLRRISYS